MESLSRNDILRFADPRMRTHELNDRPVDDRPISGVSIDSRTIKPGELFVAVRGARTDGHNYIDDAVKHGAGGIVVRRGFDLSSISADPHGVDLFVTDDTLVFLGDLANFRLKKINPFVTGVTGTNGKTSVRNFIMQILEKEYPVDGSRGNFNNRYGLPLSIFALNPKAEIAVFEMGISAAGELTELCRIAEPRIGVLTNISFAHLEGFGSLDGVIRAKAELFDYLARHAGTAIINADDRNVLKAAGPKMRAQLHGGEFVRVGTGSDVDYVISDVSINENGRPAFRINDQHVELNIPGTHNVYNASLALAAAVTCGMRFEKAVERLADLRLPEMRTSIETIDGITIINDCYNANPQSTKEAIRLVSSIKARRRIIVFGDMLELGERSEELHREIGKFMAVSGVDILLTYGEFSKFTGEEAEIHGKGMRVDHCSTHEDAAELLLTQVGPGDVILFKGSRGMEIEISLRMFKQGKGVI